MNFTEVIDVSTRTGPKTKIGWCKYANSDDEFKCVEKTYSNQRKPGASILSTSGEYEKAVAGMKRLEELGLKLGPHLYHIQKENGYDTLYMEYINCVTLHKYFSGLIINDQSDIDKFKETVDKVKEMMRVLSENKICHGDFHANNILMCPVDGLKLIDLDSISFNRGKNAFGEKCFDARTISKYLKDVSYQAVNFSRNKEVVSKYTEDEIYDILDKKLSKLGQTSTREIRDDFEIEFETHEMHKSFVLHTDYHFNNQKGAREFRQRFRELSETRDMSKYGPLESPIKETDDSINYSIRYNPNCTPLPVIVSRLDITDPMQDEDFNEVINSLIELYYRVEEDGLICIDLSFKEIIVDENNLYTIANPSVFYEYEKDKDDGHDKNWLPGIFVEVSDAVVKSALAKHVKYSRINTENVITEEEHEKSVEEHEKKVAWIKKALDEITDINTFPGVGEFYER